MIFNFNKFIKINERKNNKFNVGDYVFLYAPYGFKTETGELIPPWQNSYGQIIKKSFNNDACLVKLFSEITDKISDIINTDEQRKYQMINFDMKPEKENMVVNCVYLIKYNSKEEFDNAVEKMEIEKNIDKYNL
jgi:hypothetical protein